MFFFLFIEGKRSTSWWWWSSSSQHGPPWNFLKHNSSLFKGRRGGWMVHSLFIQDFASNQAFSLSSMLSLQVYSLKHDITDIECLMPGLILAIRKVVRLKVTSTSGFSLRFSNEYQCSMISLKHIILAEPDLWVGEVPIITKLCSRSMQEFWLLMPSSKRQRKFHSSPLKYLIES